MTWEQGCKRVTENCAIAEAPVQDPGRLLLGLFPASSHGVLDGSLRSSIATLPVLFDSLGDFDDIPCNGRGGDIRQDFIVCVLSLTKIPQSLIESQVAPQTINTRILMHPESVIVDMFLSLAYRIGAIGVWYVSSLYLRQDLGHRPAVKKIRKDWRYRGIRRGDNGMEIVIPGRQYPLVPANMSPGQTDGSHQSSLLSAVCARHRAGQSPGSHNASFPQRVPANHARNSARR